MDLVNVDKRSNRVPEAVYDYYLANGLGTKFFKKVPIKSGPQKGNFMYYLLTSQEPKKRVKKVPPCSRGKVRKGKVTKTGLKRCVTE